MNVPLNSAALPSLAQFFDDLISDKPSAEAIAAFTAHVVSAQARETEEEKAAREALISDLVWWTGGQDEDGMPVPAMKAIDSDERASKATDFASAINGRMKAIDKAREAAKRPFLNANSNLELAFKARAMPLANGLDHLKRLLSDYQRRQREAAEKRRREAEAEAARLAEERRREEAAVAKQPGADLAKAEFLRQSEMRARSIAQHELANRGTVRSAGGAVASTRIDKKVVVEDITKVPATYLRVDLVAAERDMRSGIAIPGLRWEETVGVTVRGTA